MGGRSACERSAKAGKGERTHVNALLLPVLAGRLPVGRVGGLSGLLDGGTGDV